MRYASALELIRDVRAMGESNVLTDRAKKPLTRAVIARAAAIYHERFAGPDGRVSATFDIVNAPIPMKVNWHSDTCPA